MTIEIPAPSSLAQRTGRCQAGDPTDGTAAPVPIHYEGTLYRPPSEARSVIVQATIGCSYNRCTFCAMYRDKQFRVRRLTHVVADIARAAKARPEARRVFLADGDALVARPGFLRLVLDELHAHFPRLARVACYASPQALQLRTVDEMDGLRRAGLTQYYLGIESGHDVILKRLQKGVDAAEMVSLGRKARAAGVRLSTMILLGCAGRALSLEHARASARVVNAIAPNFVSTLVMTPVEGTPLWDQAQSGEFEPLDPHETTRELREFVAHLDCDDLVLRTNHASNHLPLGGTLPHAQAAILGAIDWNLTHPEHAQYVPDAERGL